MLILAVPVMDGHEHTQSLWRSLCATVASPGQFHLLVVDNASEEPYGVTEFPESPFPVTVIRHERNLGYYRPLLEALSLGTEADLAGLVHNDVIFCEPAWDLRVVDAFVGRPDLGCVGFCGSDEVDERGGRGGGTMCNFRGEVGQLTEHTGKRVTGLHPAAILDSLAMIFRAPVVPLLGIDERTPICHFVDKIWPLRLHERGWKTAVLGVEVEHLGGTTAVAMPRYREEARRWCLDHDVDPGADPSLAVYLDAEARFLGEYRAKGLIPSRMSGWNLVPHG